MHILHISDLHLTDPNQGPSYENPKYDLSRVWEGPSPHIRDESPFDAVIVSGDLSQEARQAEYEQLGEFAQKKLRPLVRNEDLGRIIFVPGNHDVDWTTNVLRHRPTDNLLLKGGPQLIYDCLRDFENRQGESRFRVDRTALGNAEIYEVEGDLYRTRFVHVQQFFDQFYGTDQTNRFRKMNLLGEADDWSVHIFEHERIAIAGFNSCHAIDRVWHGAAFDRRSITKAGAFIDEHAPRFLKVAVWHHGPHSEEHRPDYLPISHLGALCNSGFRVGFHGHTHRATLELFDHLFGSRFTLVATGSLGAGPRNRPDAVANQFSIVDLYPSCLRAQTYNRSSLSGIYASDGNPRIRLLRGHEEDASYALVGEHKRVYRVAEDGYAKVCVQLKNVRMNGVLPLAVVTPPFCDTRAYEARSEYGKLTVSREELPDGRVRYTLRTDIKEINELTWSYDITNAFALTSADIKLRDPIWLKHLPKDYEARPHTIRILCDVLKLELEFDQHVVDCSSVKPYVEKPIRASTEDEWQRAREEERRCDLHATGGQRLSMCINMPLLGYRYAPTYLPKDSGREFPRDAVGFVERFTRTARQTVDDNGINECFCLPMEMSLTSLLGEGFDTLRWHALLWSPRHRRLKTVFGSVPRVYWAVSFASGTGVAGHAFRFRRVAVWHEGCHPPPLIYQSRAEGQDWTPAHEWLVCVPILLAQGGPAIGVLSIEATPIGASQTPAASKLSDLARVPRETARRKIEEAEQANESEKLLENRLIVVVNSAFWRTCINRLTQIDREFAAKRERLETFVEAKRLDEVTREYAEQLRNSAERGEICWVR